MPGDGLRRGRAAARRGGALADAGLAHVEAHVPDLSVNSHTLVRSTEPTKRKKERKKKIGSENGVSAKEFCLFLLVFELLGD